ncbi:MAG: MotA/TolQ/ExbB proton channel family protein [bacterium]
MNAAAEFYRGGGVFMHFISLCGLYILGVTIYKFIFLLGKFNTNGPNLMKQIQKLVMANNVDKAIKLCTATGDSALGNVMKAGLSRANRGELEIQNAIEEKTLEVTPKITKLVDSVLVFGNIATFLGLLGTIFGLIEAFEAVAHAAPEQKSAMLAQGIAMAMNTTGYGLIIAIPANFFGVIMKGFVNKLLSELDLYSVKLVNLLVSREKGAAK